MGVQIKQERPGESLPPPASSESQKHPLEWSTYIHAFAVPWAMQSDQQLDWSTLLSAFAV
jgi:hypothetical protein